LIWIGSDQLKTFGPTISSLIHKNIPPERFCLWDSKERGGRPEIIGLVAAIYKEWNAEVVFITSNWDGNKELMEGCKRLGIPAFVSLHSCSGVFPSLISPSAEGHAVGLLSSLPALQCFKSNCFS
jgi:nucleoside-diphosphate-sugar epimerase